jgi:hypothetical protein
VIGCVDIDASGGVRAGFVPCWIDDDAHPRPLGPDAEGRAVAGYVERITAEAGLTTSFRWDGDKVVAE